MPAMHPLFRTPLFRSNMLSSLSEKVRCGTPYDGFPATGVPAHISILAKIDGYSDQLSEIVSILRNNPDLTAERVLSILELNGYQTRAITPAEFGRANRQLGDDIMARIHEMIDIQQRRIVDENPSSGGSEIATDLSNLDSLPFSYEFPSVTPLIMYGLWWIPDFNSGIPALKSVINPLEKHRSRLADLRFLMEKLDNRARSLGVYKENPTLADIAII